MRRHKPCHVIKHEAHETNVRVINEGTMCFFMIDSEEPVTLTRAAGKCTALFDKD